jgi:hypothetical protein
MRTIKPGAMVRLTEEFLRSTMQYDGPEPFQRWIVVEHDCKLCKEGLTVAVDQQSLFHTKKHPRHILTKNLQEVT